MSIDSKNLRKNFTLPNNISGQMAHAFLSKVSHTQGTFISALVVRYLNEIGITSLEQIEGLSPEKCKRLCELLIDDIVVPVAAPSINTNDLLGLLTSAALLLQNNNQNINAVQPSSPVPVTTPPTQGPKESSIDTNDDMDDDNYVNDELFSALDAFKFN